MKLTTLLLMAAGGYVLYKAISKKSGPVVPTGPSGEVPTSVDLSPERPYPGYRTPEEITKWHEDHPGEVMPVV